VTRSLWRSLAEVRGPSAATDLISARLPTRGRSTMLDSRTPRGGAQRYGATNDARVGLSAFLRQRRPVWRIHNTHAGTAHDSGCRDVQKILIAKPRGDIAPAASIKTADGSGSWPNRRVVFRGRRHARQRSTCDEAVLTSAPPRVNPFLKTISSASASWYVASEPGAGCDPSRLCFPVRE